MIHVFRMRICVFKLETKDNMQKLFLAFVILLMQSFDPYCLKLVPFLTFYVLPRLFVMVLVE